MSIQKGFTVDINQCVGCRSCEVACKLEYDRQAGQGRRRRVIERTVDEGGVIRTFFISLACNHCANPACIAACPNSKAVGVGTSADSALWKDMDGSQSAGLVGVVHYETSHCSGCRRCEWACPWGQPQYDPNLGGAHGLIHKCEMCWQRIAAWKTDHVGEDPCNPTSAAGKADKRRQPACVATCIGRTIYIEDQDPMVASETFNANFDHADSLGRTFYRSGAGDGSAGQDAGDAFGNRGTKYMADHRLTNPAIKVSNKVYKDRTGVDS